MAVTTPWLVPAQPGQGSMRLLCLPFAGGSAATYHSWRGAIGRDVDVHAVQLPGRASRAHEAPYTSMSSLVYGLYLGILPWLDRPFALFGHSMGAIVALELCHLLERAGGPTPKLLVASARRAPGVEAKGAPIHPLPTPTFLARVQALGGTPSGLLDHPEVRDAALPVLRADFQLIESWTPTTTPIRAPILALGGERDSLVPPEDLAPWRNATRADFQIRMFPGDHFFIEDDRDAVLATLRDRLPPMGAPAPEPSSRWMPR